MMIKKIGGHHAVTGVVSLLACLLSGNTAKAWQQEYIASDTLNNTAERYTWDDDHQPRYEDILAERIRSSQNTGLALALPDDSSAMAASTMSVGVAIPVAREVTTGPVVSWRYDGSAPSMYNEFGDSGHTPSLTDPLWHAGIGTFGWRVDTRVGGVRPWAQISYNQQIGENQWKAQSGMGKTPATLQYGNWMDVTVGADIPLNPHMAAWASLSQTENMAMEEDYLYTLGVSAKF